jgi:predicted nucleic acid-binding protein
VIDGDEGDCDSPGCPSAVDTELQNPFPRKSQLNNGEPIRVVLDACMLINCLIVSRAELLGEMTGYTFYVPNHVVAEITNETVQRDLHEALKEDILREIEITDTIEIATYARYLPRFGDGEAACMAIAINRGWVVGSDDKVVKKEMQKKLGADSILDTPSLILHALRLDLLSVTEADEIKTQLESQRFRMTFDSFGDLL